MTETKQFTTLEIATCVTGIGLCERTSYSRMQEVMNWLCGWDVYTHEMIHEPTKDAALANAYAQFPNLPTREQAQADWKAAADKAIDAYGPNLMVKKGDGVRRESPVATIAAVAPHAEVIEVKL